MQEGVHADASHVCSGAALPGAPYLPLLPQFRKLFPGVDPNPLVASVLFYAPIIRDFISWCGVRQVRAPLCMTCSDLAPAHLPNLA